MKNLKGFIFLCLLALSSILVASELSVKAKSIKNGEWALFIGPPKEIGAYGISWQAATGFWDTKNQEFQFMAKMQGGGAAQHWIYSEERNEWRATLEPILKQPGHIWARSFDYETGDYYFMDGISSSSFLRVMRRSIEGGEGMVNDPWKETKKSEIKIRLSNEPDIGYHPNLFGKGDGGIVYWDAGQISVWRKKTDTWEVLMKCRYGSDYHNTGRGAGQYLPGYDLLVLGTGKKGNFMIFEAGSSGQVFSREPKLEKSPIKVVGGTNDHLPWAKLVVHPGDDKTLLLLGPGPDFKVWSNDKGGAESGWIEETWSHPFTPENLPMTGGDWGAWTCGSVFTHGVIWGLAYDGKITKSILWKPPLKRP